jgi:hypothetical protein
MCPINAVQPITSYSADILMHTDYYAFGQQQPGRTWQGTAEGYRYSHNSHEKEDALFKGAQSAEYWMYDSRIGRRWEMDPLAYEWQSPYAAFNNSPLYFADPLGLKGDDKNKAGDTRTNKDGTVDTHNGTDFQKTPVGQAQSPDHALDLNEVEVYANHTAAQEQPPAASTANGPASGQPQIKSPNKDKEAPPGNYYTGWWEVNFNPNLRAASNFNTQNISMPRYLGEPTPQQYMQQAQNLAYSGGLSVTYAGCGVNTQGEFSIGGKNPNVAVNGSDGSFKGFGAGGIMLYDNGFSAGIVSASRDKSGYTPGPYIVHDQTGKVTGTVQANFVINNVAASVVCGGYKSSVTAVRSFTSTDGSVKTQTIGTTINKGVTIGVNSGAFGASMDINLK